MKKNHKLTILFLPAILLLTGISALSQDKPNILWITFEDTSPHFIGCYGNENARTPVIDRLAAEGVRFTNAFSTGTVCSPSRTAIITGVKTYKTGTGNHRSQYPLPPYIKGFPYYLQQGGYYTTNNSKTDYNVQDPASFTKEAWNESSGQAGWWNRRPGQPFFAVFNFNDSHQSRTMTESYPKYLELVSDKLAPEERIPENAFALPPFYRDSPEMRKHHARVYNSLKLTDNKIGELLKKLEKDGLRDSTIIFLFADHGEGIPRGKTNGINLGYRVPFIAWFPEKYRHLSPWGAAGAVTDELVSFEDLAPTLISLAGGEIPGHLAGRVLAGPGRSPAAKHLVLSSDRADNGIDMVRTVTDGRYIYSRNYLAYMPELRYIRYMEIGEIKQQMRKDFAAGLLNPQQESLFGPRPAEYLYDLEQDPWELVNLAEAPEHRSLLESFRERLEKEIYGAKDVMFLPEYEVEQVSLTRPPYEFRLQENDYPLQEIYKAASLSGFRGSDVIAKQIRLLKSPDKIVRYWAAAGLRNQPAGDLRPHLTALTEAIHDAYPPVSATASAIVFELSGSKTAEEALKKHCRSDNMHIALMTINYLLYSNRKETFTAAIREVHSGENRPYPVKAACMDFLGSLGLVPNTFEYRD